MDPLSIAASSIAVIGLVAKIAKGLKNIEVIHNAPAEFKALINEVSDFQIVLNEFHCLASKPTGEIDRPRLDAAFKILQNSENVLLELESIIRNQLVGSTDNNGEIKVSRLAWLKSKEKVSSLRVKLRDERNKLAFFMTSMTSSAVSRVYLTLQDVSVVSQDNATNQQNFQTLVSQQLHRQGLLLETLVNKGLSTPLLEQAPASKSKGQEGAEIDTEVRVSDTAQPKIRGNKTRSLSGFSDKPNATSGADTVAIGTWYGNNACRRKYCSCSCHSLSRIKSPSLFENFFGSVFVGYTGIPALVGSCTDTTCEKKLRPRISLSYYFPRWFLQRALSLMIVSNPRTGLDLNLKTVRIVDRYSDVFTFALSGNINGLQYLFGEGLASPTDIVLQAGYTPLHYAVEFERAECCQFLLQQGADPTLVGGGQRSAGDFAWDKILTGRLDTQTENLWRLMFDEFTFLEHRKFTPVHQIVLGLRTMDLEVYLKLSTSDINRQDSSGRTPLSWAAGRGDSKSLQKLLRYGADVEIPDNNKASPLHYSAKAGDPIGLRLLIDSGADVNLRNYRGRTPLHFAASYHDGVRSLKPLIDAGADVNAEEFTKNETPVTFACDRDNVQNMKFLIEHGGTLDLPRSRNTALRAAIVAKAYRTLSIVLEHGSNYHREYENGENILHIAASKADQRTLDILADGADFSGLNADARNHDGESAMELLKGRFDVTEGMIESFERLLHNNKMEATTVVNGL